MSASEALTIWMFSTAMKAPRVAPTTAIQVLAETGASVASAAGLRSLAGTSSMVVCGVVMMIHRRMRGRMFRGRLAAGLAAARRQALCSFTLGDDRGLGVDGRLGRHAGAEQASQVVVIEHDLHRHALHDLGEVAG